MQRIVLAGANPDVLQDAPEDAEINPFGDRDLAQVLELLGLVGPLRRELDLAAIEATIDAPASAEGCSELLEVLARHSRALLLHGGDPQAGVAGEVARGEHQ